jgi:hypothetical protein
MKRLVFSMLVLGALLATSLVPSGLYANGDDDESYLEPEEKAWVNDIRSQASNIKNEIALLQWILNPPQAGKPEWFKQVGAFGQRRCYLPTPVPKNMEDIADLWDKEVCTEFTSLKGLANKPPKELDNWPQVVAWAAKVDQAADSLEASIHIVELVLNDRIIDIAQSRRAREEAALGVAGGIMDCFIATAAYGTPAAVEIDVLRQFRDEFLLQNPPGRAFVDFYYDVSPPVADFISEHEVLRTVVREGFVDPVVSVVKMTQDWWAK